MRSIFILLALFGLALAEMAEMTPTPNQIERESGVGSEIVARVFDEILIDGMETPLQFRGTLWGNIATWNAWCNYHPTAADIFGRTRFKRPSDEHTVQNKNIAVLFSLWRVYEASPQSFGGTSGIPVYRQLIKEKGFDPDDMSTDLTSPVGIGNREGWDTARLMALDNWNSDGMRTATQKNYAQPFADYTGYTPKNDPWKIKFPFKWQPLLENNGRGFFFRQENVVPFAGSAMAFSQTREEVNNRKLKSPYARSSARAGKELPKDLTLIKSLAKEVFNTSAHLTEEQRIIAEYFDNKGKAFRSKENPEALPGIATAVRFSLVAPYNDWGMDDDMIYGLGAAVATFDSMMVAWKEKNRLDLIRPTGQTMEYLFGDEKFKVWGGPGKEPVMIKAGEWQPYIRTMPHAEFPSGSSCTCSAVIEHALINTNGFDDIPFEVTIPKGASKFYRDQVPAEDFVLKIDKLSDWAKLCSISRLWAGVHFSPSLEGGEEVCKGIGQSSQDFAHKLAAGKLDAKWLSWLPEDTEKFWEED